MTTQRRGCGEREQDGLYACVETSPYGKPIEWFFTDPVRPYHGPQIRSPLVITDPRTEVKHLVLGIGAMYYPSPFDFIEEARVMGVSKRVPNGFDFSMLDPKRSGLVLIHPRAHPQFDYYVPIDCPKVEWFEDLHADGSDCIGALYGLSGLMDAESIVDVHRVEPFGVDARKVITPSTTYTVPLAYEYDGGPEMKGGQYDKYQAASILFFPSFHFEYVNAEGLAPDELAKPLMADGWVFKITEE